MATLVLSLVGMLVPTWVKKMGTFSSALVMTLNPLNPFTHLVFWSSVLVMYKVFDLKFTDSMLASLWVLVPIFFFYWWLVWKTTLLLF